MKRGKVLHSGVRKINELWNALFPETVRYVPNRGLSLTVCGLEARELCGQVEALGVERVSDHVVERVVDGLVERKVERLVERVGLSEAGLEKVRLPTPPHTGRSTL